MQKLKEEIQRSVTAGSIGEVSWTDVTAWRALVRTEKAEIRVSREKTETVDCEVWSDAIEAAIREKKTVWIPDIGHPIFLDRPIILESGCRIKADTNQMIALMPHTQTCLVRNRNIMLGRQAEVSLDQCDRDISVEGGIWSTLSVTADITNGNDVMTLGADHPDYGHGVFIFSNIRRLSLQNICLKSCKCHGIQLSNCEDFICKDILFLNHHRDGVHINGPAKNAIIQSVQGKNMGDDMVALNAWDWYHSTQTFGSISHILVEDIVGENNEIRMLPGRKTFADGKTLDCDIHHCVFEKLSGINIYKMYCQPNTERLADNDHSETVGNIHDMWFQNIVFDLNYYTGFAQEIKSGLFHMCADCHDITFSDIAIKQTKEDMRARNAGLVRVGPLSFTHRLTEDPSTWIEGFVPDAVCRANGIRFRNITIGGVKQTQVDSLLIEPVKMQINEDYPHTTPRGGTGYGTIEDVSLDE